MKHKGSKRTSSKRRGSKRMAVMAPQRSSSGGSGKYVWGAVFLVLMAIVIVVMTQPDLARKLKNAVGLTTTTTVKPTIVTADGGSGGMGAGGIVGTVIGVIVVLVVAGWIYKSFAHMYVDPDGNEVKAEKEVEF